jgi:hypothetical protein
VRSERCLVDNLDIEGSTRLLRWPWRRVPWRVLLAFEVTGLVALGVMYAATKSAQDQSIVLVAYPLCVGALMQWCFRGRRPVVRDDATPLPMLAKLGSVAFFLVWSAVVVVAVEPASRASLGPWFAWWLVIVPSIEFDRALKRHDFRRRMRGREASAELPPATPL